MIRHRIILVFGMLAIIFVGAPAALGQTVTRSLGQTITHEALAVALDEDRSESNFSNILRDQMRLRFCDLFPTNDRALSGEALEPSNDCRSAAQLPQTLSPLDQKPPKVQGGIHWKNTLLQSLKFTAIMNAFRIATEPSTRKDLKGLFWKDYINSVKSVRGWQDGDEFLVNYIGHPMQGAVSGAILVHNDPAGRNLRFGRSKEYWISRLRALGWAAAVSALFELGPFGESSIGNVGLTPSEKSRHPAAYVDLVVTPIVGTGWLIGEDMLDRYLIRRIEARTTNRFVRLMVRSFLNPSRSFANMLRGEWWWHRDDRSLREGERGSPVRQFGQD